jgi:hypothetical protein
MALTIWQAEIAQDDHSFSAPEGAELLTAREQGDVVCVWFRCDPTRPKEARRVEVCGTGWENAPQGRYVGSAHFNDGSLVFHVFEPT